MKKASKIIFWAPRILIILFSLFLAVFSLDIFDADYGFWGTILGLFMHNIPSIILAVLLIISWKHELIGAIIFALIGFAGIVGTLIIPEASRFNPIMIIAGIVTLLAGILFFIDWKKDLNIKKN